MNLLALVAFVLHLLHLSPRDGNSPAAIIQGGSTIDPMG
jgi:hypothetical protein